MRWRRRTRTHKNKNKIKMGYCLFCFNFYSIIKKIDFNFQLNYYCIKQAKQVEMSEITDYGQLMGKTIVKIFGNEMIYNDLNLYARKDTIHVEVCRRRCPETRKQYIEVYFDGRCVLNECYGQYHSCDMFYYLSELEYDMENEEKEVE